MSTAAGDPLAVRVDVAAVLDAAPFRGPAVRVMLLCLGALILDGFDIQAVAFAAPALASDWGIERGMLGPVLAAGLVGMGLGALAFGWLGDRWGRRTALIAGTVLFALASLACAASDSVTELVVWRFVTGLGLGAPLPIATAMMSEFAPGKWRHLAVGVAVIGIPLGGLAGAAIAQDIVPRLGWQSIFVLGAVLPLGYAVLLAVALPESPKYLARDPARGSALAALLNRITGAPQFRGDEQFYVPEPPAARGSVAALLAPPFRGPTLVLWVLFLTNIFVVYAFFNWLPTVLVGAGLPLGRAIQGAVAFNLGGVAGSLAAASSVGRFGSRPIVGAFALGSVLATLGVARFAAAEFVHGSGLTTAIVLAGACLNGVQIGLYVLAAHVYPTAIRATGVGAAGAMARVGGILNAVVGAAMLSAGFGGPGFFLTMSAVLVVTFAAVFMLRGHVERS
jgi:AAHS family 4-hydroxybenzoate transporter-like MFS transporter